MPVDIGKERNDVRWATGAKPVWAVLLRESCGDFSGLEFALRKDAKPWYLYPSYCLTTTGLCLLWPKEQQKQPPGPITTLHEQTANCALKVHYD
jgi:hypothetical protein